MLRDWVDWVPSLCGGAVLCLMVGCGADSADAAPRAQFAPDGAGNMGFMSGGTVSVATGGVVAEQEDRSRLSLSPPQVGDRLLYAVDSGRQDIVVVDALKLTVSKVSTGRVPLTVRTIGETDDALVINLGADEVTVLRADALGVEDGPPVTLPVVQGANDLAIDDGGGRAIAFFNSSQSDGSQPLGELQGVTVLNLDAGKESAVDVSVGFRPRSVSFAPDGSVAYVITQAGISIIDFEQLDAGDVGIAPEVAFVVRTPDDASITADGRFAIGHETGGHVVHVTDLTGGDAVALDLDAVFPSPTPPTAGTDAGVVSSDLGSITDLDLAPDGSFALAVLRASQRVVKIPLPEAITDASAMIGWTLGDAIVGQAEIIPGGELALLFSTAVNEEQVAILPLEDGSTPTYVDVQKAVQSVGVSADGETVVLIHSRLPGAPHEAGLTDDQRLDRSYAYTLLRPKTAYSLIRPTEVPPADVVITPDGTQLLMTFRDDAKGVAEVQRVDLFSFQKLSTIDLLHPPLSMGVIGRAEQVFVQQQYAGGSLSFIDWKNGDVRNLTGYELNNSIRN